MHPPHSFIAGPIVQRGMGKRLRLKGVKHTPKRLESDVLERSKRLWEDPGLLRPKCAGSCRKCHFDKTFSSIARLSPIKGDADALVKMAGRGTDDIFKAYAATASLYAAGSIPYLATAKLGGEEVSYAQRGRVGNDKLIGAQYFTDPKIRLLLYNSFAKKKRLHLYSFGDELVCSDKPNMPADYLYDTFWETPYEFKDDGLSCGHDSSGVLVIRIKSLGEEVRICRGCAKEVSTLQHLISRLVANDPMDDMEVSVEHKYHRENESGREEVPKDLLAKYSLGQVTDAGLLAAVLKDRIGGLSGGDVATYIIGTANYGSDLDAFIGALRGSDVEKEALTKFLSGRSLPVIVRNDRASEALTALWDAHAEEIVAAVSSEDVAGSMGDVSRMNPSQAVAEARNRRLSAGVVAGLPAFSRPGAVTRYADAYAKAAKVGGAAMFKEEAERMPPKDMKTRALARAFSLALGAGEVRCSGDEEDFARFLLPFVEQVVSAQGEAYRERMNTLLTACGCGESV